MLNIDEMIELHKMKAKAAKDSNVRTTVSYAAEEHKQLAKLLEELKTYRECNVCEYNKAIDDFKEKLLYQIEDLDVRDIIMKTSAELKMDIKE